MQLVDTSKRAGPHARPAPFTELSEVKKLVQLSRDAVELAVQGRANRVDRCCDQAVFDSGGSRLVVQKRSDFRHVTGSLSTLRWNTHQKLEPFKPQCLTKVLFNDDGFSNEIRPGLVVG